MCYSCLILEYRYYPKGAVKKLETVHEVELKSDGEQTNRIL